jgi:hypothetical protein
MLAALNIPLLLVLPLAVLGQSEHRLLHRIYNPADEEPSNFQERATLTINAGKPSLQSNAEDALHASLQAPAPPGTLYQVALATGSGGWDISSVKAVRTIF